MTHKEWIKSLRKPGHLTIIGIPLLNKEAKREGFNFWGGLLAYLSNHSLDIEETMRYEFKLLEV